MIDNFNNIIIIIDNLIYRKCPSLVDKDCTAIDRLH